MFNSLRFQINLRFLFLFSCNNIGERQRRNVVSISSVKTPFFNRCFISFSRRQTSCRKFFTTPTPRKLSWHYLTKPYLHCFHWAIFIQNYIFGKFHGYWMKGLCASEYVLTKEISLSRSFLAYAYVSYLLL